MTPAIGRQQAVLHAKLMLVRIAIQPETLAVCRLDAAAELPSWAGGTFTSVTRTSLELSIVCAESNVPPGIPAERGFRALMVRGPLDFSLVGVLSSLADPLAQAGISIFAISTFDTDYILVRNDRLADAVLSLHSAGHEVE